MTVQSTITTRDDTALLKLVDDTTLRLAEQAALANFLREVFEMLSSTANEHGNRAGFSEYGWEGLVHVAKNIARDCEEISDAVCKISDGARS